MRRADLTKLSPESGQGLRARKFRMAQRHSRRVRLLRWLLPSAAVSVLAIVTFFVWFDPLRFYRNLPVDFGRISITDNKLTIEAPKLTGFTQDRRPYWVTAESAAQDLGAPNRIELSGITGEVELASRGEATLSAGSGLYDTKSNVLNLNSGVTIGASGGYRMDLQHAVMLVRKGRVYSSHPVKATFPDGWLTAKSMDVLEHGDVVKFLDVVMSFKMPPEDGRGEAEGPGPRDANASRTGQSEPIASHPARTANARP